MKIIVTGLVLLTFAATQVNAQIINGSGPESYDPDAALYYSQSAIGNSLGDYEFTDRRGNKVRLRDFSGKPLLISLVFTSCYHTCPVTTRRLAMAVENARDVLGQDSFYVATIGFDTVNDTPEAMAGYARSLAIDAPDWFFLSSTPESMARLAEDLGFVYFPSPRGFDHIIQTTIIDREGRVYRQVYGEMFELPFLMEPLKELVFSTPRGSGGALAVLSDRIRLFCTVYDPSTGRYEFDYSLFIQIGAGFTVIVAFGIYLFRETRRARLRQ